MVSRGAVQSEGLIIQKPTANNQYPNNQKPLSPRLEVSTRLRWEPRTADFTGRRKPRTENREPRVLLLPYFL